MSGKEVFSQIGNLGVCPLRIEDSLIKIERGYGVVRGIDLHSKLRSGEFGGYLTMATLSGNLMFLAFIKLWVFLTYFFKFFGSVFYIFYVMKTEEYY